MITVNPGISGATGLASFPKTSPAPGQSESFGSAIKSAIGEINTSQTQADAAVNRFVTGETGDVHEVMLAMEQARMTLILAVEARNKVVEAYQEVSRMPV